MPGVRDPDRRLDPQPFPFPYPIRERPAEVPGDRGRTRFSVGRRLLLPGSILPHLAAVISFSGSSRLPRLDRRQLLGSAHSPPGHPSAEELEPEVFSLYLEVGGSILDLCGHLSDRRSSERGEHLEEILGPPPLERVERGLR